MVKVVENARFEFPDLRNKELGASTDRSATQYCFCQSMESLTDIIGNTTPQDAPKTEKLDKFAQAQVSDIEEMKRLVDLSRSDPKKFEQEMLRALAERPGVRGADNEPSPREKFIAAYKELVEIDPELKKKGTTFDAFLKSVVPDGATKDMMLKLAALDPKKGMTADGEKEASSAVAKHALAANGGRLDLTEQQTLFSSFARKSPAEAAALCSSLGKTPQQLADSVTRDDEFKKVLVALFSGVEKGQPGYVTEGPDPRVATANLMAAMQKGNNIAAMHAAAAMSSQFDAAKAWVLNRAGLDLNAVLANSSFGVDPNAKKFVTEVVNGRVVEASAAGLTWGLLPANRGDADAQKFTCDLLAQLDPNSLRKAANLWQAANSGKNLATELETYSGGVASQDNKDKIGDAVKHLR